MNKEKWHSCLIAIIVQLIKVVKNLHFIITIRALRRHYQANISYHFFDPWSFLLHFFKLAWETRVQAGIFMTCLCMHRCRYNLPLSSLFNRDLFELLAVHDTHQPLAQCEESKLSFEANKTAKIFLLLIPNFKSELIIFRLQELWQSASFQKVFDSLFS